MKNIYTLLLFTTIGLNIFAQYCPPNDLSFGTNGKAISSARTNDTRIIVQPDGKIIQAGNLNLVRNNAILIHRLNFNGSPDLGFGSSGKVNFSSNDSYENYFISDIVLQPDGKIVIAGGKTNYQTDTYSIVLLRFNNNGSADPTFGTNGEKLIQIGTNYSGVRAIALQPDGKILISGTSYSQTNLCQIAEWHYPSVFITRVNIDGNLDNSFGVNGKIIFSPLNFYDENFDVGIQSNGKILLASKQGYECSCQPGYYGGLEWICNKTLLFLRRLNADGTTDLSFGVNGQFTDSSISSYDAKLLVLPDDKIVITASHDPTDFLVSQYTRDGKPDLGFGKGGISVTRVGNEIYTYANFNDAHIQPDGKFLLLGTAHNNTGGSKSLLIRYKTNGETDSTFYANGLLFFNIDIGLNYEYSRSIAMQDNKIIVGGSRSENNDQNMIAIRILENGNLFEPDVNASGPLTFCSGDSVSLSTTFPGLYQWYYNNNIMPGATKSSFKAVSGGTYRLMNTNSNGCGVSAAVQVVEKHRPQVVSINWSGTRLSTDSIYSKYIWYLDGTAISGANSSWYEPGTKLGTYKVQVTNAENCSNFSNDFTYVITGVADFILGDTKMRYYPNPAQTKLNIDITKLSGKKTSGELYDMTGKLIISQSFRQGHNEISLSGMPAGIYSFVIRAGTETAVKKLMIVR